MHTENDSATKWQTMSRYTGKSVAYLRLRAAVRGALVALALVVPFAHALTR